jgi:hypothetical protein
MHSGEPQVRPLPRQTLPHEQRFARLATHASWSPSTTEPSGCGTLYTRLRMPPGMATYSRGISSTSLVCRVQGRVTPDDNGSEDKGDGETARAAPPPDYQ